MATIPKPTQDQWDEDRNRRLHAAEDLLWSASALRDEYGILPGGYTNRVDEKTAREVRLARLSRLTSGRMPATSKPETWRDPDLPITPVPWRWQNGRGDEPTAQDELRLRRLGLLVTREGIRVVGTPSKPDRQLINREEALYLSATTVAGRPPLRVLPGVRIGRTEPGRARAVCVLLPDGTSVKRGLLVSIFEHGPRETPDAPLEWIEEEWRHSLTKAALQEFGWPPVPATYNESTWCEVFMDAEEELKSRGGRPRLENDPGAKELYDQGETIRRKNPEVTRPQIAGRLLISEPAYKRLVSRFRLKSR
jgi:hypothetical protein